MGVTMIIPAVIALKIIHWKLETNRKAIIYGLLIGVSVNFDIEITDQDHSYSVKWTLQLKATDKKENPLKDVEVTILDKNQSNILQEKTDEHGNLKTELLEYLVNGKRKHILHRILLYWAIQKKKLC